MWHTEHTLETSASPDQVWGRVAAVATWPEWNADLEAAKLLGSFVPDGRISLKGRDQGTTVFRIATVDKGRGYTLEARLLFADLRLSHRQEACALGTRISQRIELSGPLGWLHVWIRGRRLRGGLAPSVRTLARLAAG